jgi:hypothetical protein
MNEYREAKEGDIQEYEPDYRQVLITKEGDIIILPDEVYEEIMKLITKE